MASQAEIAFALQIAADRLPAPEIEYRFHNSRKWRLDFAWPAYKVAVEIEGGVWTRGRHVRGPGFIGDCEKYNEAALLGWMVLRVTPDMVGNGAALGYLKRALETRSDPAICPQCSTLGERDDIGFFCPNCENEWGI